MLRNRIRRPVAVLRLLLGLLALASTPLLAACGGGNAGGGDDAVAPTLLVYDVDAAAYRAEEQIAPNGATVTGGPGIFSVAPPLPAGLVLDPDTGQISGTPTVATPSADYTVTVSNPAGFADATISIVIGAVLPDAFAFLADGFVAEAIHQGATKIAKCALAPDGRIFFTEVNAGEVRVIDPVQGLLPQPYISLAVLNGGHQGLLGFVLGPDFTNTGYLYVMATVADGSNPDKSVVLRFTDDPVGNVGTNMITKIDDLPVANINNGGDLVFDLQGHLLVSVGDVENPTNAQVDASVSLAGKVLRYDVLDPADPEAPATIPPDNPDPTSPEWCRGLRNTFGLAVHPVSGGVFGGDNGPTNDDELNFLEPGKNFEWGAVVPVPAGEAGRTLRLYADVIVPTALAWHDGTAWGSAYADNLFMTSYADQMIRRFEMSGPGVADIDEETIWAEFALQADDNKPLDVFVASDGSLYVATFTGIWRIQKL